MVDKRKHPRIKAENLLSYEGIDEHGNRVEKGMGKTLDLSQGGLLMETPVTISTAFILLIALNMNDEPIDIKGRVVYSTESEEKTFHTGIRFVETNESINGIIKEMIKNFIWRNR